ncbi:unnamed protein product [Brassica napus]|uniref:(rape) hypothetical protein n=1 Tax=Brassica napus TaxID=3708 RepID=A0A816JXA6_BRANA|nr:unnamed protein product [Brassica napus]
MLYHSIILIRKIEKNFTTEQNRKRKKVRSVATGKIPRTCIHPFCIQPLATGSHYPSSEGDWSFNTFSEPVAFSQRERWSFDSQHFGGSSSVVVAAADSPCQSITKDVNTVWWWIVSAMFQKMEPSCSSKAPSKSFLIWRSISSKWSKPSSKDSVSKKRFWSRHRYNRSSSSIEMISMFTTETFPHEQEMRTK